MADWLRGLSIGLLALLSFTATANTPAQFTKNIVAVGGFDDSFDPDVSRPPRPIAWEATAKVDHGLTFLYERTVFHTKKYLSVHVGTSGSWWSRQQQSIFALSGFVNFRLWPFHSRYVSPYLLYSVAGPTILSRQTLNGIDLGGRFTWQDFVGIGAKIGQSAYVEAKLQHYSNGDFLSINPGFDVPIVLAIGYGF